MRFLASRKVRIFLLCWMAYTVHFATNVVREHYPAFSLIEDGDLELDEYLEFHPDIFWHEKELSGPEGETYLGGHAYVGNQITGSLPALPALFLFDPILDRLEQHRLEQRKSKTGPIVVNYESEYGNRLRFMRVVKERGLDLRFGAATVATSAFCMAPLCALFVVMIYGFLLKRGVGRDMATGLAFIFAFATPIFYRAAYLNHNVFLMMTTFLVFALLADRKDQTSSTPFKLLGAGFAAGWGVALDYAGVVPLLVFFAWWTIRRWQARGFARAASESLLYVLGSIPPVFFLCWTQKIMYGNWFLPGQKHMPSVNYSDEGWRGFALPAWEVAKANLISLDFGLLSFAPLLALAFLPHVFYRRESQLLSRSEQLGIWCFIVIFFIFCAGNRYSLMQFNTGVRYLLPVVPFLFLFVAEHLRRLPRFLVWKIGILGAFPVWVLSMVRFTRIDNTHAIPECWRRFMEEGLQLPWLTVLRQTESNPDHFIHWQAWPFLILSLTALKAFFIWRAGASRELAEPVELVPEILPQPVEVVSDPEA